ncbi:MAG: hypothetical protein H7A46_05345 [Verrucomicrobiales bacterium]|nr:hypothetical protein [Verrucomicrobiales bacterium]
MNASEPLPPPRLILRLGGLGNRKFGTAGDSHIAEDPRALRRSAANAVAGVLHVIEDALAKLHAEDRAARLPEQDPGCSKWITHELAGHFGWRDRWERDRAGECGSVFSDKRPEVQVLTGGAVGGDKLIATTAKLRNCRENRSVVWRTLRVVPAPPGSVPPDEGLGVGSPAPKDGVLSRKLAEKQPLTRPEAHKLSRISRQRAHAYRAQSEALRHHSDLLLAVWDPDAEGKAGGTSETVALALREQIPVIGVLLRGEDKAEVRVLHSMDDLQEALRDGTGRTGDAWKGDLSSTVKGILRFPDPAPGKRRRTHDHAGAYHPRAAFHRFLRGGHHPAPWPARFWRVFDALARYRADRERTRATRPPGVRKRPRREELPSWKKLVDQLKKFRLPETVPDRPKPGPASEPPKDKSEAEPGTHECCYEAPRARAASKGYSGIYGDAHRGGIITSYLFAALAVFFAVIGAILHLQHAATVWQILAAVGEVVVIALMFMLSEWSKAEGWNLAYTHARILAEALRMMRHLGPLGVHTPLPRLAPYLQRGSEPPPPEQQWAIWYFRALVRMAPLRLKAPGQGGLEKLREAVADKLIGEQITYHQENGDKQGTLEHDIERVSLGVFVVVLVFALLHFVDVCLEAELLAVPGLIVCVGGPALIAAMHGFLSQIEASRLRRRSASMMTLLAEYRSRLKLLDLKSDPDGSEAVWGLSTEALAVAGLMMDEAAGWSMLYTNAHIHAG